jgi:hypothetical protein
MIREKNKTYVYDSFGRHINGFQNSNPNIEQGILEENCGIRCIAFLVCCYMFGVESTIKVI